MASYFCHFVSNIFSLAFSSSQAKKKKTQRKRKPYKKKMQRKEGAYFQTLALPFHFWLLLLASWVCHFISSTFFLAFSSSQAGKNKHTHTHTHKNTIEKEKNVKKAQCLNLWKHSW
jgi:hypothetical protein